MSDSILNGINIARISYVGQSFPSMSDLVALVAYLAGIEPTTFGSANQCSIQLSYRYSIYMEILSQMIELDHDVAFLV